MTFKLRSQVVIYASPAYIPRVEHVVLVREKALRPGNIIRTKGFVATDVEGKGAWPISDVTIRIIDEERLGATWERERLSGLRKWLCGTVDKRGYWDPERIIQGKNPLELDDYYHSVWTYKLPETFSVLDRIRILLLVEAKITKLDGIKSVERKTELRYEPTLPYQARK